jgi:hypothetical protein
MFRQLNQRFSQTIKSLYAYSKLAIALLLFVLCTSCSSPKSPEIHLKLSVQPSSPGIYEVIGTTNLPDKSKIAVMALRYLLPKDGQFISSDSKATYSILDRKIVEVAKGKLQATLNLWQIAPDGRLQEAWQLTQPQTSSLNPAPNVSFLATFDAAEQYSKLQELGLKPQEFRGSLVRFTTEGQPYVWASRTLAVALPTGRRPPPKLQPEDINNGWGNRSEIKPEPRVPSTMRPQPLETDQINMPLSPSEFLR